MKGSLKCPHHATGFSPGSANRCDHDQQETDRYWNAIVGNGGQESACGWCKDRWGVSWQITPRVLTEALAAGGDQAKRAFDAMMGMKKIDVAAIKAARRGLISTTRISPDGLVLAGLSRRSYFSRHHATGKKSA
jgi:hypothetical protein